jgi:hypothetical protein
MNFNIYLDEDLGSRLVEAAKESQKSRNGLIREAIDMWLKTQQANDWPEEIMQFTGIHGLPRFESHRDDLTTVTKGDPFA